MYKGGTSSNIKNATTEKCMQFLWSVPDICHQIAVETIQVYDFITRGNYRLVNSLIRYIIPCIKESSPLTTWIQFNTGFDRSDTSLNKRFLHYFLRNHFTVHVEKILRAVYRTGMMMKMLFLHPIVDSRGIKRILKNSCNHIYRYHIQCKLIDSKSRNQTNYH